MDSQSTMILMITVVGIGYYLYKNKWFSFSDADNPANKTAEKIYSRVTGSKDAPGADVFDVTHDENGNPSALGAFFDQLAGIEKGVDY